MSNGISTRRAKEVNLQKLADLIRTAVWSAIDTPGWGNSVFVPHSFLVSEVIEDVKVGLGPCRPTISGELVRIKLDRLALVPFGDVIKRALIREIEPFIIGVGEISTKDTPEGFVICLGDCRDEPRRHLSELSSLEGA